MIVTCGQTTTSGAISCSGVVDTPATITPPSDVPEPASLALLGSALVGFGGIGGVARPLKTNVGHS